MANRPITILVKKKQTTSGVIPSSALMGEPFINLFDGVLKFSATTGGSFESSSQSNVFEVGSALYNQKISNRLNINDKFIISGNTGIISTYSGITGAGLAGTFLSGTSTGFVLGNISDIQGVITSVQPGTNITTGGTANAPTINLVASPSINGLTFSGTVTGNALSAATLSGGTILSGSTNLYSIFEPLGVGVQTVSQGSNITTGGTVNNPIINVVASPSFNDIIFSGTATGGNLYATNLSGGSIFSGSTNLQSTFNLINSQVATKANLSGATFTGVISATAITDTALTSGWAVYAGSGGLLKTTSGFTYDETAKRLYSENIQIGTPSLSGIIDIWGDVIVHGQSISAFTSQLYVEDNNIFLNFNPTANTTSTSLGAGFTIQDGDGIAAGDVFWDIRGTGTTVNNRSFATNLADIRIRESGTTSSPNGAYVLASSDILDGGTF